MPAMQQQPRNMVLFQESCLAIAEDPHIDRGAVELTAVGCGELAAIRAAWRTASRTSRSRQPQPLRFELAVQDHQDSPGSSCAGNGSNSDSVGAARPSGASDLPAASARLLPLPLLSERSTDDTFDIGIGSDSSRGRCGDSGSSVSSSGGGGGGGVSSVSSSGGGGSSTGTGPLVGQAVSPVGQALLEMLQQLYAHSMAPVVPCVFVGSLYTATDPGSLLPQEEGSSQPSVRLSYKVPSLEGKGGMGGPAGGLAHLSAGRCTPGSVGGLAGGSTLVYASAADALRAAKQVEEELRRRPDVSVSGSSSSGGSSSGGKRLPDLVVRWLGRASQQQQGQEEKDVGSSSTAISGDGGSNKLSSSAAATANPSPSTTASAAPPVEPKPVAAAGQGYADRMREWFNARAASLIAPSPSGGPQGDALSGAGRVTVWQPPPQRQRRQQQPPGPGIFYDENGSSGDDDNDDTVLLLPWKDGQGQGQKGSEKQQQPPQQQRERALELSRVYPWTVQDVMELMALNKFLRWVKFHRQLINPAAKSSSGSSSGDGSGDSGRTGRAQSGRDASSSGGSSSRSSGFKRAGGINDPLEALLQGKDPLAAFTRPGSIFDSGSEGSGSSGSGRGRRGNEPRWRTDLRDKLWPYPSRRDNPDGSAATTTTTSSSSNRQQFKKGGKGSKGSNASGVSDEQLAQVPGTAAYVIPGVSVTMAARSGGTVEFVPLFLSKVELSLALAWVKASIVRSRIAARAADRRARRQRWQDAFARMGGASSSIGGGSGSSSTSLGGGRAGGGALGGDDDDEEGGGLEDPSDVKEFLEDLGAAPSGSGGGARYTGPTGIVGSVSALAVGVLSAGASAVQAAGDAVDRAVFRTPLGWKLVGKHMPGVGDVALRPRVLSLEQYVAALARYNAGHPALYYDGGAATLAAEFSARQPLFAPGLVASHMRLAEDVADARAAARQGRTTQQQKQQSTSAPASSSSSSEGSAPSRGAASDGKPPTAAPSPEAVGEGSSSSSTSSSSSAAAANTGDQQGQGEAAQQQQQQQQQLAIISSPPPAVPKVLYSAGADGGSLDVVCAANPFDVGGVERGWRLNVAPPPAELSNKKKKGKPKPKKSAAAASDGDDISDDISGSGGGSRSSRSSSVEQGGGGGEEEEGEEDPELAWARSTLVPSGPGPARGIVLVGDVGGAYRRQRRRQQQAVVDAPAPAGTGESSSSGGNGSGSGDGVGDGSGGKDGSSSSSSSSSIDGAGSSHIKGGGRRKILLPPVAVGFGNLAPIADSHPRPY